MKVYRIKTLEDIEQIPLSEPIQLEIYLKNAVIPLVIINGNCFIRAVGCSFPNLQEVNGKLSIDAADANFPQLIKVEGSCNIHEIGIKMPLLNRVLGKLTVLQNVELPCIESVIELKNESNLYFSKLKTSKKVTFDITHIADALNLPEHGFYNLRIYGDDIKINVEHIDGTVEIIKGSNIIFANLLTVNKLIIGAQSSKDNLNHLHFPKLETIKDTCIINAEWIFMNNLCEVGGKLTINNMIGNLPRLSKVGEFSYQNDKPFTFPSLEVVLGNFKSKKFTDDNTTGGGITLKNFINIFRQPKDILSVEKDYFPKLRCIGGMISMFDDFQFSQLNEVHYINNFVVNRVFPRLEKVDYFEVNFNNQKPIIESLPNIKNIKNAIYTERLVEIIDKIDNIFFRIAEGFYVSKTDFFINSRWGNNGQLFMNTKYPLSILVSILKMRHSSFSSFVTREYEREWHMHHPRMQEIFEVLEAKWHTCKAYTFSDIFKINDRNFRRFCFSYIGVSTMMKAVEAKRIASNGIELNYYKYDSLGNKIPFKKHNIYETYEADIQKFEELRNWRNNEQKIFAVKCWCTSTEEEHWLWIEAAYKNDPLEAIASTFRIHRNVVPHIKCLKRQGDILICEMKKEVIPEGEIRPLTKDEYFGLLEVET